MSLHDALEWRYAAKRMNGQKVPAHKINAILKAAQYAPTSMGLQPFTIFVIENKELREQIKPLAYHQPQITEASHLLVFTAWTDLNAAHVDAYINEIMATRGVTKESLEAFKNSIMGFVNNQTDIAKLHWAANQTYIAFSFALAEAALQQVDATPMEGFNAAALDDLLQLKEKGLTSITLLPLGYRDEENDIFVHAKKVRRDKEKLFIHL